VLVLGYCLYRLAMFIVGKFEEAQAKCETDRQRMAAKLDEKDAVIIAQSNKCIASIDENTKVTKELCTEIRTRRAENTPPKGHHT
jgi:hypothetical protein